MLTSLWTTLAVILRIISNSAGNVYQKKLSGSVNHPLVVNFLTYFLLSLVCIFIGFLIFWPSLGWEFWGYSLLAGLIGATGNGFLVRALQTGDLSILGPINSYKSVVGILFGVFLLGEIPNVWGMLGVVLVIYGSYFVLDTTEERFSWNLLRRPEIQYRLWAMILAAIEAVLIKKIILVSSVSVAFISWCVFGAIFSFLLLKIYRVRIKTEWMHINQSAILRYLALISCVGLMQISTNYALDHLQVGYALSFFQLSILLSVFFGYRFFQETDLRKKLLGSVIMIIGSVLIILLKDAG